MSWFMSGVTNETHAAQKAALALGAFAVAGVAVLQLKRVLTNLREEHIKFDFPIEEQLFIGWGGGNPRRMKRSAH